MADGVTTRTAVVHRTDGAVATYQLTDVVEVHQINVTMNDTLLNDRKLLVGSFFSDADVIEYFVECGYTCEIKDAK